MNAEKYLKQHREKYELSPQDEIKLLFQAHFGGGHFVPENGKAISYIKEELSSITDGEYSNYELTEKVSDEYSRLHLIKLKEFGLSSETAAKLFILSSRKFEDSTAFEADVKRLVNKETAEKYLSGGVRPISHSEGYRAKYSPHYRVISNEYIKYIPLFCKIDEQLKEKKKLVIGIDGKAGSGKSTLANVLKNVYGASIVRADDFFVPLSQKSDERRRETGGNIDYVRMKKEVFENLSHNSFEYTPFLCSSQSFGQPIKIDSSDITVIEGSYSSHPYFDFKYDVSVFIDIDDTLQKERIIDRNGSFSKRFFDEFIPKENEYFEQYRIKEKADIIISNR